MLRECNKGEKDTANTNEIGRNNIAWDIGSMPSCGFLGVTTTYVTRKQNELNETTASISLTLLNLQSASDD